MIKDAAGNVTGQILLGNPSDPAQTTDVDAILIPDTGVVDLIIQQIDQRTSTGQPTPTFSPVAIEGGTTSLNLVVETLDQRSGEGTQAPAPQFSPPVVNQAPLPVLQVSGPLAVAEGNLSFVDVTYEMAWTNPTAGGSISVDLAALPITATAGSDFALLTSGLLTLTDSQPTQQVQVRIFGDTTFEPDETFTLQASTTQGGATIQGQTQVTILNDDLPPLSPSSVKDDGDWGFSLRGIWTLDTTSGGWKGDFRTQASTSTSIWASWTLGVAPGMYQVYATWVPAENRTNRAQYTISMGATPLGIVQKNQRLTPGAAPTAGGTYDGKTWELLGTYTVSGPAITVRLNNAGSGLMVADGIIVVPVSPLAAAAPASGPMLGALLTPPALQAAAEEAIARWAQAGATPAQLEQLRHSALVVADLPPGLLGLASSQVVWIDRDAAGSGWYVDPTPRDDAEYARATTAGERLADLSSPAAGRIDLLTAVVHEFGHLLGLDDHEGSDAMAGTLAAEIRRLPSLEPHVPRMSSGMLARCMPCRPKSWIYRNLRRWACLGRRREPKRPSLCQRGLEPAAALSFAGRQRR